MMRTPTSGSGSCAPGRKRSAGGWTSNRLRDAAPRSSPCSPSGEQVDDMRILIVDDHALVRRGMTYVVKEGFPDADVLDADSSAAAIEVLHGGGTIDLALVDVRMPDLDGLELLRAIKAE